jgi:hypothetical protein
LDETTNEIHLVREAFLSKSFDETHSPEFIQPPVDGVIAIEFRPRVYLFNIREYVLSIHSLLCLSFFSLSQSLPLAAHCESLKLHRTKSTPSLQRLSSSSELWFKNFRIADACDCGTYKLSRGLRSFSLSNGKLLMVLLDRVSWHCNAMREPSRTSSACMIVTHFELRLTCGQKVRSSDST